LGKEREALVKALEYVGITTYAPQGSGKVHYYSDEERIK